MSGKRSRDKGQRGEREWRDYLRMYGYDAERGRQYSGGPDSPDIKSELDGQIHFEVKRAERIHIHKAIQQAREEAGEAMPVVAHRRNRDGWLVTLDGGDFLWLLQHAFTPQHGSTSPQGSETGP